MNAAKVTDIDYINFLIAAPKVVSCAEAWRVQPDRPRQASHDALTRLLQRLDPDLNRSGKNLSPCSTERAVC